MVEHNINENKVLEKKSLNQVYVEVFGEDIKECVVSMKEEDKSDLMALKNNENDSVSFLKETSEKLMNHMNVKLLQLREEKEVVSNSPAELVVSMKEADNVDLIVLKTENSDSLLKVISDNSGNKVMIVVVSLKEGKKEVVSKPLVEFMIPNQPLIVSHSNLDVIYSSNQLTVKHDIQLDSYTENVPNVVRHQFPFPGDYLSKLCSKFKVCECAYKVFVDSPEPKAAGELEFTNLYSVYYDIWGHTPPKPPDFTNLCSGYVPPNAYLNSPMTLNNSCNSNTNNQNSLFPFPIPKLLLPVRPKPSIQMPYNFKRMCVTHRVVQIGILGHDDQFREYISSLDDLGSLRDGVYLVFLDETGELVVQYDVRYLVPNATVDDTTTSLFFNTKRSKYKHGVSTWRYNEWIDPRRLLVAKVRKLGNILQL